MKKALGGLGVFLVGLIVGWFLCCLAESYNEVYGRGG